MTYTVLLMLQWFFLLKTSEIWPHELSHGKSHWGEKRKCWGIGVVLRNGSHSKQRHMFYNLLWPPSLVLTWYNFSPWVGIPHLHMPPFIEMTLWDGEPGVRVKTRRQAGMRSVSLLVGTLLELFIFILHPTLPRPSLHSALTAHPLPVLHY